MIITNKFNLPRTIIAAVQNYSQSYHQDGDISATSLIQPPRIRQLMERHQNSLRIDAADRIWPLLGSNTHYILQQANIQNALQEERLAMTVGTWTITGQPDLYEGETVYDYKITSVWSVLHGVKPDWIKQLNIYAALLRSNNFPVKSLKIIVLLRDWSRHQVRNQNYPKTQALSLPVPLWSPEKASAYISNRVCLHQACEILKDNDLPVCTAEERWEKPTMYAVRVKTQKKAKRVLDSKKKAEAWAADNLKQSYVIEVRTGESVRCVSYCDCSAYCNFN